MNARTAWIGALFVLLGCSPHRPGVQPSPSAPVPSVSIPSQDAALPDPALVYRDLSLASLDDRTPVLTYHDVIRSRRQKDAVWFDCTATEFAAQMAFLYQQGAHVITLEELRRHLTTG